MRPSLITTQINSIKLATSADLDTKEEHFFDLVDVVVSETVSILTLLVSILHPWEQLD